MKVLHSSLRFDRDRATVSAEVERWTRYRFDLITFTEATRFRGVIQAPGYQTIQPHGHPELAALVRDGIRAAADVLPLSDMGIPRRGGEKPYALRLDLPDVTVFVVHLPSGVERPRGFRRNTQAAVWRDCVRSLAAAVDRDKRPGRDVWVVGDFNLNARRRWVRRFWARHLGGFALTAPVFGTHGNRAIDYALIRNSRAYGVRTFLTAASDHRAVLLEPKPKEAPVATINHLPKNLPTLLRAAGLKVVEVGNWHGRSRPLSTGSFTPVGVLCHHTATAKASSDTDVLNLLIRGRSDLPGPLCHLGLGRDGTVYLIASGRANHAGKAKASGTVAAGDGNALYIGIEAFNDGRGEPWPKAQYDAYVKLAAALSESVTGNSVNTVRGHKETSVTGKIDPTFDMDQFRDRVRAAMNPPAPVRPRPATRFSKAREQLADVAKHRPRLAKRIHDFLNSTPKR